MAPSHCKSSTTRARQQVEKWPGVAAGRCAEKKGPALKTDEVIAPLRAQGMEPIGGNPAEFAAYIAGEVASGRRWSRRRD